ncbi:MAG: hypothetical protein D6784_12420 [Chloroflexi bacterium]|nr:MAG: hypothetical protein D6784_12420 [Chloroflexota bacterium]
MTHTPWTDDQAPTEENASPAVPDPSVEALRDILFHQYRERIAELEAELEALERRLSDPDRLAAIIAPSLGDAIRRNIRDARDEMIEALYPIIGQTVVRAVSEAVRDLARTLDARMRQSLDFKSRFRRLWGRMSGLSQAEMALRDALPFSVLQIFLIHRETGLLLHHISLDPHAQPDSDIIGGMLTAIRDFVNDAFNRGQESQLDEIQYGDRSILIETAQYVYLAVVVQGVEPSGFRAEMRRRVIDINHTYESVLRQYRGDATLLSSADGMLRELAVYA